MEMPENRKKGLIISFYLSKFDDIAYNNLGFGSQAKTHEQIGQILNIKSRTIQNWRDEFDPYETNTRVGWYQHPLLPSRAAVKDQFDGIEEYSFRKIVKNFLNEENNDNIDDILTSVKISEDDKNEVKQNKTFSIQMQKTGKIAEEYFQNNYKNILDKIIDTQKSHTLVDTRSNGCGYDFKLNVGDLIYYIEIKGIFNNDNNIRFTDKEWNCANEKREKYILITIKNLSTKPEPIVIVNPYEKLNAEMKIQQVIQISWITSINS